MGQASILREENLGHRKCPERPTHWPEQNLCWRHWIEWICVPKTEECPGLSEELDYCIFGYWKNARGVPKKMNAGRAPEKTNAGGVFEKVKLEECLRRRSSEEPLSSH